MLLTDYRDVKYDWNDILWAFMHVSLNESKHFDTVKCYWAAYSKNKKTLTTEKTSMISIRIAITDIAITDIRHVQIL